MKAPIGYKEKNLSDDCDFKTIDLVSVDTGKVGAYVVTKAKMGITQHNLHISILNSTTLALSPMEALRMIDKLEWLLDTYKKQSNLSWLQNIKYYYCKAIGHKINDSLECLRCGIKFGCLNG